MENTIVQLSKYVITFLMICFTVQSFAALKERDEDERHYILMRQIIMIILMNFICFFVMFLQEGEVSTIQMFLLTMAYILGVQILYRLIYRKASMILLNNMCMLLSISMIILTRLSVSKAMSQYKILAASTLLCFIIPVIVRKGKFLKNLTCSELPCFPSLWCLALLPAVQSCRSKSTALRSSSPKLPRSHSCSLWQACCARIIPLETL